MTTMTLNARTSSAVASGAGLRGALAAEDLRLEYQPIFELQTGRLVGAEALARWPLTGRAPVPPSEFIPLAERSDLMVELGHWALANACRTAAELERTLSAPARIFVNVSPSQLRHRGFADSLEALLSTHELSPTGLAVELTESSSLLECDEILPQVRAVRALGVQVGLDDFGTGFATHAALRSIQEVDFLKIDREFVAGLPTRPVESAIVSTVIDLAHSLGAAVVAEGIEDGAQVEALRAMGCDLAQGFLLAHPLPLDRFKTFAADPTCPPLAGVVQRKEHLMNQPTNETRGEVLVADDDPVVRELVNIAMGRAGFRVNEVGTGSAVPATLRSKAYDLLVLDMRLPDTHGLDVLTELRDTTDIPTIVLSGCGTEADRVLGLQAGADDYMVKPFSPRELVARAEALLRRARAPERQTFEFGDVRLDLTARDLFVKGGLVETTAKEFALLAHLASNPRTAFSRRELLAQVWDSAPEYQSSATVTEHVRRLRQKIEPRPGHPRHLVTVRGSGYRLEP